MSLWLSESIDLMRTERFDLLLAIFQPRISTLTVHLPSLSFTSVLDKNVLLKYYFWVHGGGLMVVKIAFNSIDPTLNPAEIWVCFSLFKTNENFSHPEEIDDISILNDIIFEYALGKRMMEYFASSRHFCEVLHQMSKFCKNHFNWSQFKNEQTAKRWHKIFW